MRPDTSLHGVLALRGLCVKSALDSTAIQSSYLSTEAIAVMIGEEIVLASVGLAAAVWAGALAAIIAAAT